MQTAIIITIFIHYASAVEIGEHKLRSRYDLVAYVKTLYYYWEWQDVRNALKLQNSRFHFGYLNRILISYDELLDRISFTCTKCILHTILVTKYVSAYHTCHQQGSS